MVGRKKISDVAVTTTDQTTAREEMSSYQSEENQKETTDVDVLKQQVSKIALELERYKDDTKMRKILVGVFTGIIFIWLAYVMFIVGSCFSEPRLTDKVLITLLSSTTVTVIGMMHIILKNLFPSSEIGRQSKNRNKATSKKNRNV
jgi:hypothetical protein